MNISVTNVGNIQQIRALHAIAETNINVQVAESEQFKLQPLDIFFKRKFDIITEDNINFNELVIINHQKPLVKIGKIERPLLFPKEMCEYLKPTLRPRDKRLLFIGLITPSRQQTLYTLKDIVVMSSSNGRVFPQKTFDSHYYSMLDTAEFTLCLNGDFVWTYRFFEACLCGSIPVIEDYTNIYNGFKFHTIKQYNDTYPEYNEEWAEHNRNLAIERLTVDSLILETEINKLCLL